MKTELRLVTTHERSVITTRRSVVSSDFGPLNPASTTLRVQERHRVYREAQLMELLNSLEREVASLQSRYFTVYDTLNDVTQRVRALLSDTTVKAGTDAHRS